MLINEVLTHTDEPQLDFVELFNYSTGPVDLAGCILTDDPATNRFVIPAGTVIPAMGFASFDQNQLGFALSSGGEAIFLYTPEPFARSIDGVKFGAQANGVALGRSPDGTPTFLVLDRPTPGKANGSRWSPPVVINELMYKPISRDRDDEYVELFNPGAEGTGPERLALCRRHRLHVRPPARGSPAADTSSWPGIETGSSRTTLS